MTIETSHGEVLTTPISAPLMALRVRIASSPWRITPAWAVIAGACTARPAAWNLTLVLQILAAAILADSIWSIFWQLLSHAPTPNDQQPAGASGQPHTAWLPYSAETAPADRLQRWLQDPTQPGHTLQGWPIALALTALLAHDTGAGRPALILSLAVILLSLIGLAWTRQQRPIPAGLLAVLIVTLPWLLGHLTVGALTTVPWGLLTGFTLLVWGLARSEQQATRPDQRAAAWLAPLGAVIITASLILTSAPIAAGLTGALALIAFWQRPGRSAHDLAHIHPWLWAALAVVALIGR